LCGVAGIYAYHYAANQVDRRELVSIRDHMKSRGPDGSGLWTDTNERIGLAHRRLAIIDLSENGLQPMHSDDNRFVITFNGEIYNFKELRNNLIARGFNFRSRSDTEVLLHLYRDRGVEMVRELRGMFAFAIWDSEKECLLLARDPFGIKPLYYSDDGWTVRFASQVKALLAGNGVSRDPDPAGTVGFFLLGSVPEPFTIWRAIRSVPAGTTVLVDRTGARAPQRYFSIASFYRAGEQESRASSDDEIEVRRALLDSVSAHLIADVPVGAFLSAGIDSGALVGLMRDAGAADIKTVTVGFQEFRGRREDETALASQVASNYGTQHTNRIVTRGEFELDLPRIIEAMDQPSIDGINTWFVSKAAHELGLKVAISGLGGDELFGGYPSFRDIPRWVGAFGLASRVPFLGRAARMLGSRVTGMLGLSPKAAGMIELGGSESGAYVLKRGLFMPWEMRQVLDRGTITQGLRRLDPLRLVESELQPRPQTAFGRVATLESAFYMRNQLLRDADWASMAHSLEVRVPLVDATLLSKIANITTAARTTSYKALLSGAPLRPLPSAIRGRAKTGFTTPIATWQQSGAFELMGQHKQVNLPLTQSGPWARQWASAVMAVSGQSWRAA
jgi:asparagine synthase (glutamine-hydrolysing)